MNLRKRGIEIKTLKTLETENKQKQTKNKHDNRLTIIYNICLYTPAPSFVSAVSSIVVRRGLETGSFS